MITDFDTYLHKFRQREIELLFEKVPAKALGQGLELGAGDGFQSTLLAKYFNNLICTEYTDEKLIRRDIPNVRYQACDAEDLPFAQDQFDFIFSSNLLEHLPNIDKALAGMYKVLKNDGLMIHVMPNRTWKFLLILLYYPYLLKMSFNFKEFKQKLHGKQEKDVDPNNPKKEQSRSRLAWLKYLWPQIHGAYKSHWAEFIGYGQKRWLKLFAQNNFTVVKVRADMPLVSGYNLELNKTRSVLKKLGLTSSYAYIITKKGKESPLLKYFK
ncbi:class I SAM-dependent methyltransferase [Patescibacteria group bacterium]|nr:class I SAM-dependent methyltransferase [Patescibacteria group bacterium]